MKIALKLFAIAKQLSGEDTIELELSEGATVADLQTELSKRVPDLQPMMQTLRIAVNSEYASEQTVIRATDEVACIPPVSGG